MIGDDGVVRTWDEDQALLRATQGATQMFREERDMYREALVAIENDTDDDHMRNYIRTVLDA